MPCDSCRWVVHAGAVRLGEYVISPDGTVLTLDKRAINYGLTVGSKLLLTQACTGKIREVTIKGNFHGQELELIVEDVLSPAKITDQDSESAHNLLTSLAL